MANPANDPNKSEFDKKSQENSAQGINNWNDRLDENLEPEDHNDPVADENAKEFSEKLGSGNQSDDANG